ncbi:MAG: hemerythrin HHE cation-binding protein [Alphaproteobacteria bacterium]|nr:MAG: hemerythrin HHE cation-binding protein [Alphaproteobacteria bacterium]
MNLLEQLPERAKDLIRSGINTAFTSISAAGVPIDTPLLIFYPEDLSTIDLATGLAYPAKAERARRNPKVGLLIEGRADEPVISIAGMAAVRDSNIEANAIRYISEVGHYGPSLMQPWEVGRNAVWYWSRIIMEVMPAKVMWWENRAAMEGAPNVLEQPAGTVYPASDPAPAAQPSASVKWPATPWHEHIQSFLDRKARGQLSLFDADGFALPISAKSVKLEGDMLVLDLPKGAPWTQESGTAGFTFEGRATFVGDVARDGSTYRFKVERMLPYMPMVIDAEQVLLPEGKEGLMERLRHELGRRGQGIPNIPAIKPEATPGNKRRQAWIASLTGKTDVVLD